MKRTRGRPKDSIRRKKERFFSSPNHVAAAVAAEFIRRFQRLLRDGSLVPISHADATRAATMIDGIGLSGHPDYKQTLELLRKGRTKPNIDAQDLILELLNPNGDQVLALELLRELLLRSKNHKITIEIDTSKNHEITAQIDPNHNKITVEVDPKTNKMTLEMADPQQLPDFSGEE
jgi:hypothetical protein